MATNSTRAAAQAKPCVAISRRVTPGTHQVEHLQVAWAAYCSIPSGKCGSTGGALTLLPRPQRRVNRQREIVFFPRRKYPERWRIGLDPHGFSIRLEFQ